MTPRRWLALAALLSALDTATTIAGLRAGLPEGNPVMALALADGGVAGLILAKVALIAVTAWALVDLGRRHRGAWVGWLVVVGATWFAVVSNAATVWVR
jgi:hypothetical protein